MILLKTFHYISHSIISYFVVADIQMLKIFIFYKHFLNVSGTCVIDKDIKLTLNMLMIPIRVDNGLGDLDYLDHYFW